MTAEDRLREGDLGATLSELQASVRKNPADAKLRIFLFQLLCVLGDWDRALTQLRVCGELDVSTLAMVQTYRELIACEMVREKVFAGKTTPLVFGEPAQWIALLIEALKPQASGDVAAAAALRGEAFELAPAVSGEIDGAPFAWIADADMRLGPVLEIVVNGKYYWAPFSTIAELKLEAPSDLRDRVWTPVQVTWANGGELVAFIPTRYPGAPASDDDAVKLARKTAWADVGGETFIGAGQRLFATDSGDVALLDARSIKLDVAPSPASAPEGRGDG